MLEINFVPSLKQMTLNKIAVLIAVKNNVVKTIPENIDSFKKWYKLNERPMTTQIEVLPLPHSLKLELLATFKEISHKIQIWKRVNQHTHLFYQYLFKHFHLVKWSALGGIDEVETAKTLLNLDMLDIDTRYYMACYYSLESYILKLRPEVDRLRFGKELTPNKMIISNISIYWQSMRDLGQFFHYDNEQIFNDIQLYLTALHYKNLGAMKYFFKKLSAEEKKEVAQWNLKCLASIIKDNIMSSHSTDLFIFLLPRVKQTVERSDLTRYAANFLNFFLSWPMQGHFYEAFDQLFEYLELNDFPFLLDRISFKATDGCVFFAYNKAFRTVWLRWEETRKMCRSRYDAVQVRKYSESDLRHFAYRISTNGFVRDVANTPDRRRALTPENAHALYHALMNMF